LLTCRDVSDVAAGSRSWRVLPDARALSRPAE